MRVLEEAEEESWQGVMSDAEGGWDDVEIHDQLGDQQRRGGSIEAIDSSEDKAQDAGEAGTEEVIGGEPLVLVGGGHEGGTGGPERIEQDDKKQNSEQVAAGRDVA